MKRILLNGLHYEPKGAGISRYTYKLIETFIKGNYPVDILVREKLVDNNETLNLISVDKNITSSTTRILEEQWRQRKLYKEYDLVHFPDYATPIFYSGNKVATIHDMAMHTMKDKYTFIQNMTKRTLLEYTIEKAKHLICDSHFAKKELLHYYPNLKADLSVIPLGIEQPHAEVTESTRLEVLKRYNIRGKFILYVGTLAPHKNIVTLIKAFAHIKEKYRDYQLVICGKKGWMYQEIFDTAKTLDLEKSIIFTGFACDEELEVLYHSAEFLALISLYEGFGLPPLEAMIRKCPVLLSDIDIFRETCGSNALYCKPLDSKDVAGQMLKLIEDAALRKRLSSLGAESVKGFTWEKTAKETFSVYQSVLGKQC